MGEIYAAKTNHMTNPVGFLMDAPVFSWKVRDCAGKRQKSARIIVSKDQEFRELCHDTGNAELDSLGTRIELPLEPRTRYYWKVTVTTDVGEEIESGPQYFETAKRNEAWVGKWIGCQGDQERHPIFSRTVRPAKAVKSARLYIAGLGLYEAFFTGSKEGKPERIGDEYLTPYCNNYDQWIQYQTYDLTDRIGDGGTLSVLLGNGWYKGRFGLSDPKNGTCYGEEWKLIAELHLAYEDGEEIIASDETWSVTRSKICFSNIYDGEKRDDTLPPVPATQARLTTPPKGVLTERLSLPVRIQKELRPVELVYTPKGETVLDLGQEITGIFRLRVHVPQGTTVTIQTGEVLQNGCFYRDNLRSARSEYVYVSDGSEQMIRPRFTFYGYRYVKVDGIPDLSCEDYTALVLYSDYEPVGKVETGHALLNKLISNIEWGMRGNFLDVPTDCPQRDERMGWTGDAQVFSATASYLADTYAFYRKYLYDMYREQLRTGGMVPETIPTFGPTKTSSAWGDAACILPWNVYLFSGDKTILETQMDSMKAWVDYIRRVDGDHHGWRTVFHYGDWLALDRGGAAANNVFGATDEAYIADIYYAVSAEIVAKAAKALGQEETRREYQKIADWQWQTVREEYFTVTGRSSVKTQTGLVLALKYHLSKDEDLMRRTLKKLLRENKYKLNTGFVGTPLLCNVLSDNGMTDMAYTLLLNEEYPGWLHEVKLGATTVWERWNSLDENGQVSSTGMNSLNHYAYGAVLEWIFRHAAGIDLKEESPGARTVRICPQIHHALGHVTAAYDSASGLYQCEWRVEEGNRLTVKVKVPFGATAEVLLPCAPESMYQDSENPLFETVRDGVCTVSAGEYEVSYEAVSPIKKSYTVDSTIEELLSNPQVRTFLAGLMEVDMIPDTAYELTLRETAKLYAGEIEEQQAQMLNLALSQY